MNNKLSQQKKERTKFAVKERLFFLEWLKTQDQGKAFLKSHPNSKINSKTARENGSRLMRKIKAKYNWELLLSESGLGFECIITELQGKLKAKKTEFYKGKNVAMCEDNTTQMRALELLVELHGLKRQEIGLHHEGAIVIKYEVVSAPSCQN